jgi:hypothetical protein
MTKPRRRIKVVMKANVKSILGIAAASAMGVLSSAASSVTYDFGQVSGGPSPAGTPPWVEASFSDVSMPADTIQLTLTAENIAQGAYVSCWYFNINSLLAPNSLKFTQTGSAGSFGTPTISTGANEFKAGPDGKFDILFSFNSTGDNSTRFTSGDSVTFAITGISGLTVQDFNELSTCAGGSGAYTSAAHIESGAADCPSWVNPTDIAQVFGNAETRPSVPDTSSTITLLGASLAGIEALRRKLRFRARH